MSTPTIDKRLVIASDLDEVLGQFLPMLIQFHNDTYKTKYQLSDFFSYYFPDVWGGSSKEADEKMCMFFKSTYFQDLPLIESAYETLSRLKSKFRFFVVTSRQHFLLDSSKLWLQKHFNGIFEDILTGNHYGLSGKKYSKSELCQSIGAHILIDDSVSYCQQCSTVLPHAILFDLNRSYGWNKNKDGTLPAVASNVHRLSSWSAVEKFLLNYYEKFWSEHSTPTVPYLLSINKSMTCLSSSLSSSASTCSSSIISFSVSATSTSSSASSSSSSSSYSSFSSSFAIACSSLSVSSTSSSSISTHTLPIKQSSSSTNNNNNKTTTNNNKNNN
eukprot:TRINITY_DN712_c5_g1_i1.p1 TRINITY_DN712_c5_g1~~TRINITY_DN712_c5_g1_i1.p1  ORF type:complete len:330 (-),score=113.15 TRINITY_DN712_c5_g1_i1:262-1251(-)